MTLTTSDQRSLSIPAVRHGPRALLRRTGWHVAGALGGVRTAGAAVVTQLPGSLRAARTGARGTTRRLQVLSDPTLRWLIAGSAGLAAGLFAAGAPRVVTSLGIAPAVVMSAAIALRPAGTEG